MLKVLPVFRNNKQKTIAIDTLQQESLIPYAGALVRTERGIALQIRDNKPDIQNPGMISLFGGRLEDGESPISGVTRELFEELSLNSAIILLGLTTKNISLGEKTYYLFFTDIVPSSSLILEEGQGIFYVTAANIHEVISEANQGKVTHEAREALKLFLEQFSFLM